MEMIVSLSHQPYKLTTIEWISASNRG